MGGDIGPRITIPASLSALEADPMLSLDVYKRQALRTEVQPLIAQGDYTAVLDKLANLRAPVDSFFDNVMVNAEDPALRQNRLAILSTLQGLSLIHI